MGMDGRSITLANLREIEALEAQYSFDEIAAGFAPAQTIYSLFETSAARYAGRCAISMVLTGDEDEAVRRVSYQALLEGITQSANLFASLGGENAGVAYLLPSLVETHFVLWGAEVSGYAVPVNPLLSHEQLVELLAASGAKILVTVGPDVDAPTWEKSVRVKQALPALSLVCIGAPAQPDVDCLDFHTHLARQRADALAFDPRKEAGSTVACFHTGGTTGVPKLVIHTNRNQICAAFGAAALLSLTEQDKVTNGMPLFHVGGAISSSLAFFIRGAEVVILSPAGLRNPAMVQRHWRIVRRMGVTIVGAVPTALAALLAVPFEGPLTTVRFGITGAAPLSRSTAERFTAITGKPLHEILGMTESGGVTAVDPTGAPPTAGSVGVRAPYTRMRVRRLAAAGDPGDDCAPGEIGTLYVTGPTVSPGYLDPSQNGKVFRDGWLDTGDLAYLDADGKLFIAGRAKDIIIRSGHNIDPAMVEAAFARHPAVAAAVVVGQPDAYAGELPVAYVTKAAGKAVDEAELLDFARQYISERPAWPKQVHVVDALPLTAVGKVHRPTLRADAAVRLLRPALQEAAPAARIEVEARDGGKRGLEVFVTASNCCDDAAKALDDLLRPFLFEYSIRRM